MSSKILHFTTLVLAALTVGMRFAHVLELPPKLEWAADLYFPVQTSLYRLFVSIGPILDVCAVLTIGLLAYKLRGRHSFRYAIAAVGCMLASLAIWALFVGPAAMQINQWLTVTTVPTDALRNQWQFGQTAAFLFDLTGFSILLILLINNPAYPEISTS